VVTQEIWHSGPGEGRLKGVRGHQDTSLDNNLLEAANLDKVERAAEALSSGREAMDAKQATDYLRISESEFKRMAPGLPRHAVTERRYIYLRSELLAWLTRR
jgi:hypothetical protein